MSGEAVTFPKTREEVAEWMPAIYRYALDRNVLAVATTRIEGTWKAYISQVPGKSHADEFDEVLRSGTALPEQVARTLFPYLAEVPYAR